jgi:hypothetical protein
MNFHFTTNLDEAQPYVRGIEWSGMRPMKGHRVRMKVSDKFTLELEVVGIFHDTERGYTCIELHVPSWFSGSIKDWIEWFKRGKDRR